MKKRVIIFTIFLTFFLGFSHLHSKDCPSRLFANLKPIGDTNFYWGVELKSFFYNYNGENYLFGSISSAISYEGESSSFQFEGIYKDKKYTPCKDLPEISPLQIRRLNFEKYLSDNFSINLGRQEITVATGLVLDDFFDGLSFKIGDRSYLSGGAGVYSIYVAKEAIGCQKCFFYNYRPCWKNLVHTEWGDILMGFLQYNLRIKKSEYGLLYVRSQTQDPNMRTNTLSLYSKIRITRSFQIFSEFAIQHFDIDNDIAYGINTSVLKTIRYSSFGSLSLKLSYLHGSTGENSMFTPIFGTTYFGERQHFTVRQGNIYGAVLKYIPSIYKKSSIKFAYYLNSEKSAFDFISDEFDATLELNLDKREKYKILATYSVWSGVYKGSQIAVNLRIVF